MIANILVVDDEQSIADLIELYLKNENYNVFKFYNGQDALNFITELPRSKTPASIGGGYQERLSPVWTRLTFSGG